MADGWQAVQGDGPSSLCSQIELALPGAAPCHRLDAPTEGLVVVGRTAAAKASLSAQFREREVCKTYRAVVHARPTQQAGVVSVPIDGVDAETRWRVRWGASAGIEPHTQSQRRVGWHGASWDERGASAGVSRRHSVGRPLSLYGPTTFLIWTDHLCALLPLC